MPRITFTYTILATTLLGCTTEGSKPAVTVRDSAGVRIVENATPQWTDAQAWRLSTEPSIEIGGVFVGEDYELFEVWSAVRLSDGRIVVANGGSYELRFYAADGTFARSTGQRGNGPGEFQNLRWMRPLAGDSVITYDFRQRRFSVFDSSGAFARSFRLVATEAVPFASVVDIYADGSILAQGFAETDGVPPSGLQRYRSPLYNYAGDGTFVADLGMFGGNEVYYKSLRGGFSIVDAFFPLWTYRRTAGDHLYIAANDSYELRRYTPEGTLTDLVRRFHDPVAVTEDHIRLERERRLAQASSDEGRQTLSDVLDEMPVPETFPAYQQVHIDEELNVWVQEYTIPGVNRATWSVFDTGGTLLGLLEAPLRFEPYHIGSDFVLGEWRDEDDVEYVQLYELIKP